MIYAFVHLSDLHYRPGWEEENGLVCDSLLKDIANECTNTDNTYVAFTGDLVFAAESPKGYSEFLERFATRLDAMGLDSSRRISIPGNHDVDRSTLRPKLTLRNGAVSATNTERKFNDNLAELESQYFNASFARYRQCEAAFASYRCCADNLGGAGWELPGSVGIYCLNSALASSAGLDDADGKPIDDKRKLPIATRQLHQWLAKDDSKIRVLLGHHPLSWLEEWASTELERIISSSFHLVLTGHLHSADSYEMTRSVGHSVFCAAPALFTRKSEQLGYSIIRLDTETGRVTIKYRQWVNQHRCFVAGAAMTGTDSGEISYNVLPNPAGIPMSETPIHVKVEVAETATILEDELKTSLLNYSSKTLMWVDRDLAPVPETHRERDSAKLITPTELSKSLRNCVIRAPREFGLTCVGKKIAHDHHKASQMKELCLYIEMGTFDIHKRSVEELLERRGREVKGAGKKLVGIVVDGWVRDHKGRKLVALLRELHPSAALILLETIDLGADIERILDQTPFSNGEIFFLWSLTQNRIRSLVEEYVENIDGLNSDVVTRKIIKDIDTLNIFRTPANCLMFLRLAEQAFDDSPVNRTELIHRVLFILFYRFDQIPTYASRPDLKDCEYVLGNFCEWLTKENKSEFSKNDFFAKGLAYCEEQFVGVDVDILFTFLVAARIIVFNGVAFQFRFTYWLLYFAAHRMHHSPEFASFLLSDRRYAAMPEIIEFYTGIDRRRVDAVKIIAKDLVEMAATVSEKTGISTSFGVLTHGKWTPSKEDVKALQAEVKTSIANSSLPPAVKDTFADRFYDRSRPYSQEIATFVSQATLLQMFHATKGAARALRNSDHVPPADKILLLNAVMDCWNRVAQVLAVISPILAAQSRAHCEGMNFSLSKDFDAISSESERWLQIMNNIPANVIRWFEDDLYSSKLGPLINKHIRDNHGALAEIMLLLVLIRQRPEGWAKEVKRFVVATERDSIGLLHIFSELRLQKRIGFLSDADHEQVNHLSAFALAKHEIGANDPNRDQVRAAAKALGDPLPPGSSELRHSKGPDRNKR